MEYRPTARSQDAIQHQSKTGDSSDHRVIGFGVLQQLVAQPLLGYSGRDAAGRLGRVQREAIRVFKEQNVWADKEMEE